MAAVRTVAIVSGVAMPAVTAFAVETVVGGAGFVEGGAAEAAGVSVFHHDVDIGLDISGVKIYLDCNEKFCALVISRRAGYERAP